MASGSMAARPASSPACGFITIQATAETSTILSSDLMNWTTPSRPNRRLNPSSGLSFFSSGFIRSGDHRKPCWTTLPAAPATAVAASTAAMTGRAAFSARFITATPPVPLRSKVSG